MVVVIVKSLDGEAIEDVAVRVVERWGLGQKDKNNGVLLLVALKERRARIEVGYGLEDRLTDALSRRILEERLFPAFRKGDREAGVLAACDGIIAATRGAYTSPPRKRTAAWIPVLIPVGIIIVFILIGLQRGSGMTGSGRRRIYRSGPIWWGSGGFGGGGFSGGGFGGHGGGGGGFGGFSGGGGMSGGGGASGSW